MPVKTKDRAKSHCAIRRSLSDSRIFRCVSFARLLLTEKGNKCLLYFIDHFPRFCLAMLIARQDTETIAREFVTKIVTQFGVRVLYGALLVDSLSFVYTFLFPCLIFLLLLVA